MIEYLKSIGIYRDEIIDKRELSFKDRQGDTPFSRAVAIILKHNRMEHLIERYVDSLDDYNPNIFRKSVFDYWYACWAITVNYNNTLVDDMIEVKDIG